MATAHKHSSPKAGEMSADMQQCIQNCLDCFRVCVETIEYCVKQGGHHTEPDHLRIMADCKDICLTSANFMMRQSDLHKKTCGVCAEVCQRCGDDCAKMGDDATMKRCADTCHRCAESCRKMSGGNKQ